MTKTLTGTAGEAVDALLVFVGRDLIQFAFTYPLSTLDPGLRTVLLIFGFFVVAFFAFLSCFPDKSQNDRFLLLEATSLLYLIATGFATYFAYRDDIAPRGPNQFQQVMTTFENMTYVSLGNNTGYQDLAHQTYDNMLASTEYLHVFIMNILCMVAIILLYYITKFVRRHTLDFLGLITCFVTISQVFTQWYNATQSCVQAAANEARQKLMSPLALAALEEEQDASLTEGGLTGFVSEAFKCAGNFDTLQGTTLVLTTAGCVAIVFTLVLVLLRLGVIKRIMDILCCCCLGSACAAVLDTATCSVISSPVGDAFVLVGIVVSMLSVGVTHFLSSAWAVELKNTLEEGGQDFRDRIAIQNGTAGVEVFDAIADVFKEKWETDSFHAMVSGVLVVITALTLLVHVLLFVCCTNRRNKKRKEQKRLRRASTGESVEYIPPSNVDPSARRGPGFGQGSPVVQPQHITVF